MARYACGEDGWRSDAHREDAESFLRDDVRSYYGEDLREAARLIDPETGDGWDAAERACGALADRIVDGIDTPFGSLEVAAILVTMIEEGDGCAC